MTAISLTAGNTDPIRAANVASVEAFLASGADTGELPKGVFHFDVGGCLAQYDGSRIFGQGQYATKLVVHGSGALFNTNGKSRQHYAGFTLQGYGNHTGGPVFYNIGPAGGISGGSIFEDLTFEACHDGIYNKGVNSSFIERIHFITQRGDYAIMADAPSAAEKIDLLRLRGIVHSINPTIALAAGRGTCVIIQGHVHTIVMDDVNSTRPWRGVVVQDPYGLPEGQGPQFLETTRLRVDFPKKEGILLGRLDEGYFHQTYINGSLDEANFVAGSPCKQIKISQGKITGAWKANIYTDADDTEIHQMNVAYANAGNVGQPAIWYGPSAWTGTVVGGSAKGGSPSAGIQRSNPGANILRCCTGNIAGGSEIGF